MLEKRKATRIKEEYKITTTEISKDKLPSDEKIIYGLTKDISLSGLRIQSNAFFSINTMCLSYRESQPEAKALKPWLP